MSGIIAAAVAGLLLQQAAPHPSTLEPYSAPAIRPFEPPSDFGLEAAEGDGGPTGSARRALAAPVSVDSYARSYEFNRTDVETAYERGVASAELRTDQTAGPLDGLWRIADDSGRALYDLMLLDPGAGRVEGGWRTANDSGGASMEGADLTLEGIGTVRLERAGTGWRGQLTAGGRPRPVTLSRPD